MPEPDTSPYFRFFNEIGIIDQLSNAVVQSTLPKGFLVSHFGVLNHLTRVGNGTTPLALATAFQVPKTTMTHTLSGLIDHELIEFRPNPKDGRSKTVWITEKGSVFRANAIERLAPEFMPLIQNFPVERIAEVLPLLEEIRKFLDESRNP